MRKPQVLLINNTGLIVLDLLLPLLMEFRDRYGDKIDITVIIYDVKSYAYLRKNYHIMDALRIAGANIIVARTGHRLLEMISLIRVILGCVGRTTIILKASDTLPKHRWVVAIMKILGTVIDCRALSELIVPSAKIGRAACEIFDPKIGPRKQVKCDILLSAEPIGWDVQTVYVGYLKKLPVWDRFVKTSYYKEFKATIGRDYYFFVLSSTDGLRLSWLDEPDRYELLCETLTALNKFLPELHAVLRPHPVSNIESVRKAIKETGFTNYTISYAHPSVISMGARFFISNCFSTACLDAWRMGVPIIDYYRYDSRLEKLCGGWSVGGELVDYYVKSPEGLLNVIEEDMLYYAKSYKRSAKQADLYYYFQKLNNWRYWDDILDKDKKGV